MGKNKNPWTKLSSKQIYDNPWINLKEDQVLTPSGSNGIYGCVSFKNLAIGIIPIDEDMNTWLVGQYRYTLDQYSWEIPMGGGALDTDPLQSAKRELKEETGIMAQKWELLLNIHTSNSVTNEKGFVYTATELSYGTTEFDETEVLEIKKLPLKEAINMAMNGAITDSLSLAGLLKIGYNL